MLAISTSKVLSQYWKRMPLKLAEWFPNNCMKWNEDKCHPMVFGDKSNDVPLNIRRITIEESTEDMFLGVILDKRL